MTGPEHPIANGNDASVIVAVTDGVLSIMLNRPDKLNALTPPMVYRLREVLTTAARDPQVRCVLVKGAGRAFCSGGDVSQFSADDPNDPVATRSGTHPAWNGPEHAAERLRERAETALLLHTMPKPTVAMLRGPAMGAGLSLAAACDIRIADETAVFGTAFARVGLSGDYGASYFLSKLVGPSLVREMFFLHRRLDAVEAFRQGLVNRVVEPAALETAAMAVVTELAAGPPVAWRYIKQNLVMAETERLTDVLDVESRNMVRTMGTSDAKGAIDAFLNKKTASFEGH